MESDEIKTVAIISDVFIVSVIPPPPPVCLLVHRQQYRVPPNNHIVVVPSCVGPCHHSYFLNWPFFRSAKAILSASAASICTPAFFAYPRILLFC